MFFSCSLRTPIGDLKLTSTENFLVSINFSTYVNKREVVVNSNTKYSQGLIDKTLHYKKLLTTAKNKSLVVKAMGVRYDKEPMTEILKLSVEQLKEYFYSLRKDFSIPIKLEGTPFMLKVWEYVKNIPYGEVISYKGLANAIDKKNALRAVGQALNKNPLPIVIPCHRVILSSGRLGGYSSGVKIKRWLLERELKNTRSTIKI